MSGELATFAMRVVAVTVLAPLAGAVFVWLICWWADRGGR